RERLPERAACRLMVGLLDLADQANVVVELAGVLAALHERGELPEIDALRERFAPRPALMPTVQVVLPALAGYDVLIDGELLEPA
ncbi:MAG: IS21 family transposase, partial [Burkholderiales bacterium]|nr:IS21 family transposase [Burkholderiales bacterium]